MLSLFLNNKKGAVTVMLSFLLIAVLSVNSTFLETSRYRSLEIWYKELEENAAFSVLSKYDRDLFKNFGLLAIDQNVDKEKFMEYLYAGLNEGLKRNGADHLLDVSEGNIDFKKIYDLSQSEIFKEQVDEFCAYRAPIYLLNEVLDIEDALKSFLKQLENMIPFLDVLKDVMDQAKSLVDLSIALDEYSESSKSLRDMKNEYEKSVDEFNAAVATRNTYIASEDENNPIDDGILESLNNEVSNKAGEVKNHIESLKNSLGDFYEKYTAFYDAYDSFQGGKMKVELDRLDMEADTIEDAEQRESTKQMVKSMKTAYDDSKETCGKVSDLMKKVKESDIRNSQEELTVQYEDLQREASDFGEITAVSMTNGISLMDLVQLIISTGEALAETISKISEALSVLGEAVKILKVLGTGATYEPEYNNIISRNLCGNLKVVQESAYNAADRVLKDSQIRKTDKVAQSLGFDMTVFTSSVNVPDNNTLQNELQKATDALDNFLTGIQDLNTSRTPIISQLLARITAAISYTVIFIEALINLAAVAASVLNGEDLGKIIYQKVNAAVYANSMFSNRTTDVGTDKRLNGSSYAYYSTLFDEGTCFDMANVEYIISGGINEMANQKTVFNLMLGVRALCNIPAVLNNDIIMEVVDALGSTGILIPVAIIIFFIVMIIEAYLDMIFIIYTPEGVEFIKMQGYLDFTGEIEITEYFKQLKVVIEEIRVRQTDATTEIAYDSMEYNSVEQEIEISADLDVSFSDSFKEKYESLTKHTFSKKAIEKKNAEKLEEIKRGESKAETKKIDLNKWAEEYKEGLTKASYSDHTLLLLILLISSDKIYSRSADLVSMQMKQIKKGKGAVKEFNLEEMATYLRVDSTVYYKPLLPIPVIPGLNDSGLKIRSIHYSGY